MSLPRLATKTGATISCTNSKSDSSERKKSSESSDSPPPIRKNPIKKVILLSSIAKVKLSWGKKVCANSVDSIFIVFSTLEEKK